MMTDSSPAEAFETLRREVALLRRALEGLAAEQKAQPDYSGVLAGIGARIKEQNAALGAMAEAPALQLTPEAMGQQILRASEQVRAEDAMLLGHAKNTMTAAARQIEASLATARTAHAQQQAVRWSAILGIVAGGILGAAGAFAAVEWNQSHPTSAANRSAVEQYAASRRGSPPDGMLSTLGRIAPTYDDRMLTLGKRNPHIRGLIGMQHCHMQYTVSGHPL